MQTCCYRIRYRSGRWETSLQVYCRRRGYGPGRWLALCGILGLGYARRLP